MNQKIYMIQSGEHVEFRSNLKKVFIHISSKGVVRIKKTTVKNYVSFWRNTITEKKIHATVTRERETIDFIIELYKLL